MGFRPDLDLSNISSQYEVFREGESTAGVNYVLGNGKTDTDPRGQVHIPQHLYQGRGEEFSENPVRIGMGPIACSSCTALVLSPQVCWDANGYYASLGVHWRATRKELMRGYNAVNGQYSVYLTYVLQQLLNKEIRAEYDRTPLGEPYLNDMYVQDALKRLAAQKAQERSARGEYTTARQVIEEEWEFIPEELDEDGSPGARSNPAPRRPSSAWAYSYYAWRTHYRNGAKLGQWQTLLVSSLSLRSVPVQFAVGFLGKQPHRYVISRMRDHCVVYLNEDEPPTEELAAKAASDLIRELGHNRSLEGNPTDNGTP